MSDYGYSNIKFIDYVKPKLIFFENVRGFTLGFKNNDKKGKAYSTYVVEQLQNLGYSVKGQLIDFSKYGIPQKRTRFILVGIQNDFINENPSINKDSFFEGILNNKEAFLVSKNLTLNPTLENAISDLLQANGVIESETPNFKEGVYGEPISNYQKFIRKYKRKNGRVDSHRFARHTDTIKSRFKIALDENLTSSAYRERFQLKKSSKNS